MASLPSYQDAVSPDWLPLVAPYVSPEDYPALCGVNRRYWDVFAPRIWSRIPRSDTVTGLDDAEYGELWTEQCPSLLSSEQELISFIRFGLVAELCFQRRQSDEIRDVEPCSSL